MRLRVIVTGGRYWTDAERVFHDLDSLLRTEGLQVLTVVHGNCQVGPERAAKQFCAGWRPWCMFIARDVVEEVHEPAWAAYGLTAPIVRNTDMVACGADLLLAYPGPNSPEVADCMAKAAAAGIPVWDRAV
jgi:hypothetical protein